MTPLCQCYSWSVLLLYAAPLSQCYSWMWHHCASVLPFMCKITNHELLTKKRDSCVVRNEPFLYWLERGQIPESVKLHLTLLLLHVAQLYQCYSWWWYHCYSITLGHDPTVQPVSRLDVALLCQCYSLLWHYCVTLGCGTTMLNTVLYYCSHVTH